MATWRSLQRVGAITLTPGAVILPYSEHLLEQLEWIAEDVMQRGGDAYVLPVTELAETEEQEIERRMRAARREEYEQLREAADDLSRRARTKPDYERRLAVLERALTRAVEKDHLKAAPGRTAAQRAIRLARQREE